MSKKNVLREGVLKGAPDWRPGRAVVGLSSKEARALRREMEGRALGADTRLARGWDGGVAVEMWCDLADGAWGWVQVYRFATVGDAETWRRMRREQAALDLALAFPESGDEAVGPGPVRAFGAGPAHLSEAPVSVYDAKTDGVVTMMQPVIRRGARGGVSALPEDLRAVARRYADLVERLASPTLPQHGNGGGSGCGGGRGAGVSDGGAAARCGLAEWVRRMEAAMAGGPVPLGPADLVRTGRARVLLRLDLVRRLSVDGWSLSQTLSAYGWPRSGANKRKAGEALVSSLRAALSAAHDRA